MVPTNVITQLKDDWLAHFDYLLLVTVYEAFWAWGQIYTMGSRRERKRNQCLNGSFYTLNTIVKVPMPYTTAIVGYCRTRPLYLADGY